MRLDEYFAQCRANKLDKQEQMTIYSTFLHKSHRVLNFSKVSYYAKITSFSFAASLVAIVVYVAFGPQTNGPWTQLAQIGDGVTLEQQRGVVQADTVGRILLAKGEIHIFQGDKEVSVTDLTPNDKVLLAAGAKVTFTVRDGLKATILGPASFVLESLGTVDGIASYGINLLEGDYLEVVSYATPPDTTKQPLPLTTPKPTEKVVIKTPDFQVENVHTDADVDLVIATDQGKTMIANNGDDFLIKSLTKNDQEQIVATVKSHQMVSVADELEVLSPEEAELALAKLKDTPLAIRYEVEQQGAVTADHTKGASLAASVASVTVEDTKEVIPEAVAEQLRSLSAESINAKLQQMMQYYGEGNAASFAIAYANVLKTIDRSTKDIAVDAPLPPTSELTLAQGALWIEDIINTLDTHYYVAPQYKSRLQATVATLRKISTRSFGESSLPLHGQALSDFLSAKGLTLSQLLVP